MSDELSDERRSATSPGADPFTSAGTSVRTLFTAQSTSVAAFALAVVTLTGNSILVAGIQSILGQGAGGNASPFGYYLSLGVAVLVPAVLAVLLARPGLRADIGWEATLARAAVPLAALGFAGGVLTVLGGLLTMNGLAPF